MAGVKSSVRSLAAMLALLIAIMSVGQNQMAEAQSCAEELSNLNVCAQYVVPGATPVNPNAECCNALQSVQHDCLCNTLRIASQLPSQCNLPPLNCDTN